MANKPKNKLSAILVITFGAVLMVIALAWMFGSAPSNSPNRTPASVVESVYPPPAGKVGIVNDQPTGPYPPPQTNNSAALAPQPPDVYPPPTTLNVDTPVPTSTPSNTKIVPTSTSVVVNLPTDLTAENVPRVTSTDAKAAFDAQKAVFVDVRSEEQYTNSHIPGAVSIPESSISEHLKELNPNDWIIPYCT
jgi:hypothetical protein